MKETSCFQLPKHEGPYHSWPQKTELLKNGELTGRVVSGFIIEAQYEHEYGFLLVTSWDCLFEEAQTFSFLSPELDIVCEETVGAAYASVVLESHEPMNNYALLCRCDGDLDIVAKISSGNTLTIEKYNRMNGEKWLG